MKGAVTNEWAFMKENHRYEDYWLFHIAWNIENWFFLWLQTSKIWSGRCCWRCRWRRWGGSQEGRCPFNRKTDWSASRPTELSVPASCHSADIFIWLSGLSTTSNTLCGVLFLCINWTYLQITRFIFYMWQNKKIKKLKMSLLRKKINEDQMFFFQIY